MFVLVVEAINEKILQPLIIYLQFLLQHISIRLRILWNDLFPVEFPDVGGDDIVGTHVHPIKHFRNKEGLFHMGSSTFKPIKRYLSLLEIFRQLFIGLLGEHLVYALDGSSSNFLFE